MANQIRMTPDTMRTRAKETDNQEKQLVMLSVIWISCSRLSKVNGKAML